TAAALKERVLVAKVAMLGTATRDYDRIGDEVVAATNQVATNKWKTIQGAAARRNVDLLRFACAEIAEKLRERLFAGAEEDRVGVRGGFVGQRRDMKTAQANKNSFCAVVVGEAIRPVCVGDVDLDHDEVGAVVGSQRLNVLVSDAGFVVRA